MVLCFEGVRKEQRWMDENGHAGGHGWAGEKGRKKGWRESGEWDLLLIQDISLLWKEDERQDPAAQIRAGGVDVPTAHRQPASTFTYLFPLQWYCLNCRAFQKLLGSESAQEGGGKRRHYPWVPIILDGARGLSRRNCWWVEKRGDRLDVYLLVGKGSRY